MLNWGGTTPTTSSIAGGTMGAHEFGHTVQFWGHSFLAGFAPNDNVAWAYGTYGLVNFPGAINHSSALERGISRVGSFFF